MLSVTVQVAGTPSGLTVLCVVPVETVPACEVDAGAPVLVLVAVVAGTAVWAVVAVLVGALVCVLLTGTLGGGGSGGDWLFEEKKLFTAT